MAVSIISVGLAVDADMKLLQAASITGARKKRINVLPKIFIFQHVLHSRNRSLLTPEEAVEKLDLQCIFSARKSCETIFLISEDD